MDKPDSNKNLQSSGSAQPVKTNFSSFNEATTSPQEDKTTFSSPESKPEESQFLGEASRNITFNVWLNHPDRTLEAKEVTSLMENIASHFTNM